MYFDTVEHCLKWHRRRVIADSKQNNLWKKIFSFRLRRKYIEYIVFLRLKVMEICMSVSHMSPSALLVTDLCAAFDTVDHVALLKMSRSAIG